MVNSWVKTPGIGSHGRASGRQRRRSLHALVPLRHGRAATRRGERRPSGVVGATGGARASSWAEPLLPAGGGAGVPRPAAGAAGVSLRARRGALQGPRTPRALSEERERRRHPGRAGRVAVVPGQLRAGRRPLLGDPGVRALGRRRQRAAAWPGLQSAGWTALCREPARHPPGPRARTLPRGPTAGGAGQPAVLHPFAALALRDDGRGDADEGADPGTAGRCWPSPPPARWPAWP